MGGMVEPDVSEVQALLLVSVWGQDGHLVARLWAAAGLQAEVEHVAVAVGADAIGSAVAAWVRGLAETCGGKQP
jgi:hypothetical protein